MTLQLGAIYQGEYEVVGGERFTWTGKLMTCGSGAEFDFVSGPMELRKGDVRSGLWISAQDLPRWNVRKVADASADQEYGYDSTIGAFAK